MATTYYFLSAPEEQGVMDWFRSQPETLEEHPNEKCVLFGSLNLSVDGNPDASRSPLVSIFLPKVRRDALWTVGEVHFLVKNSAGTFPQYERVRRRFQSWLGKHPVAWERKYDGREGYGYYLEGTIKNLADKVFALPMGLAAFEAGQYFVAERDNDAMLDTICRLLSLRGVECK